MEMNPKVRNLKYYPIKSCAGIEVQEARIEMAGLAVRNYKDHEFAVVDAQPDTEGVHLFVSQRGKRHKGDKPIPQMALIRPEPDDDGIRLTYASSSIDLPYDKNTGREFTVRVFDDVCHGAVDQGDETAKWLSDVIGFNVRLVKAVGSFNRMSRQNYMLNDNPLRFQDGYPIHWFPIESVNELSEKAGEAVQWQRFRPQIVAEGMSPQYEHQVRTGYLGDVSFIDPKPCERCTIPLVDQETGKVSKKEPNHTLATYKQWKNIYGDNSVIFGENMLPCREGTIRVGDTIGIVEMRNPPLAYGERAA